MKICTSACCLLAAICLWASCNNKSYTPDQLPPDQLNFGDGGGFTGAATAYILLENGQLFRCNSIAKDTTEIAKIPKKQAKRFLKEVKAMHLEKMNIEEPGNIYYFIGVKENEQTHKITWGNPNYAIDPKIQAFYKKLMTTIKQAKKPEM